MRAMIAILLSHGQLAGPGAPVTACLDDTTTWRRCIIYAFPRRLALTMVVVVVETNE